MPHFSLLSKPTTRSATGTGRFMPAAERSCEFDISGLLPPSVLWLGCSLGFKRFVLCCFRVSSSGLFSLKWLGPRNEPKRSSLGMNYRLVELNFHVAFSMLQRLMTLKPNPNLWIFSDKAVICLRDGQMCFLCRVGDMRNTHLVEAHVRLQFIRDRETVEGEVTRLSLRIANEKKSVQIEPLHQFEMKVGPSVCDDDRLFLVCAKHLKTQYENMGSRSGPPLFVTWSIGTVPCIITTQLPFSRPNSKSSFCWKEL